jgi:hypothetical protein
MQVQLGLDVGVRHFQARLEASANQRAPGHLRPQPVFEAFRTRSGTEKYLIKLLRVDAHVARDVRVRLIHVGFGDFDAEALGLAHFQYLVDKGVEDLLPRRDLLRA